MLHNYILIVLLYYINTIFDIWYWIKYWYHILGEHIWNTSKLRLWNEISCQRKLLKIRVSLRLLASFISSNKETLWTTDVAGLRLLKFNNFKTLDQVTSGFLEVAQIPWHPHLWIKATKTSWITQKRKTERTSCRTF